MEYILGTSSVQWSKVEHLESKQLFLVKTADGAVYTGTMNTPNAPDARRPVEIRVVETSGQEVVIDRSRIVQMDTTSEKFFQRFNGSINTGIIYSKGNQSTQYSLGSQLTYPGERWGAAAGFTSTLSSSTGATCAPQEFDPTLWAPCNIVTSYPAQANSCSLLSLIRNEFEARSVLTRDRLPVLDSTALLEFRAWQFWLCCCGWQTVGSGGLCREATMLRDTLVGLIEPMWCGAGVHGSRAGFPRAAADIGR